MTSWDDFSGHEKTFDLDIAIFQFAHWNLQHHNEETRVLIWWGQMGDYVVNAGVPDDQ